MTDSKSGSRAGSIFRRLAIMDEESDRKKVEEWIAKLIAAENVAKANPNAKRRHYQVNYRVDQAKSEAKGEASHRREALVQLLKSLSPVEWHQSTSGWIVWLHIEKATDLANLLTPPLDARLDFLSVGELTPNRVIFGDAKLKSK